MDFEFFAAIIFLIFFLWILFKDRKNVEIKYGLILRRTKKGKKIIYDLSRKYKKLFSVLGIIGIFLGFSISIYTLSYLLNSFFHLILNPEKALAERPAVQLVFPRVGGITYPTFILGIPLLYWILSVFTILFSHEPLHALVARSHGIKIKSLGIGLFFVFPLAFVEPDDKMLKKVSWISRLKVYAAGSFGNFILAGIIFFLIVGIAKINDLIFISTGVDFESTIPNTSAYKVGLKGTVVQINNYSIRRIEDLENVLKKFKPGDMVNITTSFGTYRIKLTQSPDNESRAFIGIQGVYPHLKFRGFLSFLGEPSSQIIKSYFRSLLRTLNLLNWLFVINIGVASINLLPLKPLDGGLMFEEIFKKLFGRKKSSKIIQLLSSFCLFLLLFNLFGRNLLQFFL